MLGGSNGSGFVGQWRLQEKLMMRYLDATRDAAVDALFRCIFANVMLRLPAERRSNTIP
jgi:hypothetical protein